MIQTQQIIIVLCGGHESESSIPNNINASIWVLVYSQEDILDFLVMPHL